MLQSLGSSLSAVVLLVSANAVQDRFESSLPVDPSDSIMNRVSRAVGALHALAVPVVRSQGRDSSRVDQLGFSDRGSECPHTCKFALWLAGHPSVGLRHMLALTRRKLSLLPRSYDVQATFTMPRLAVDQPFDTGCEARLRFELGVAVTAAVSAVCKAAVPLYSEATTSQTNILSRSQHCPSARSALTKSEAGERHAGIHAIEVYSPRRFVSTAARWAHVGCGNRCTGGMLTER